MKITSEVSFIIQQVCSSCGHSLKVFRIKECQDISAGCSNCKILIGVVETKNCENFYEDILKENLFITEEIVNRAKEKND